MARGDPPSEDPNVDPEGNHNFILPKKMLKTINTWDIWTPEEKEVFLHGHTECSYPFGEYFTKPLDAKSEYHNRIRSLFLSFCIETSSSFSLGLLQYRLMYGNTRNVIFVIANNMESTHRQSLLDLIGSLDDLKHMYLINCYVGGTIQCSMNDGHSLEYNDHPEISHSIGITNRSPCFSLGAYLRMEGDDDNDCALSVYHQHHPQH